MKIWHFIQKRLAAGKPVMLVTVIKIEGSSPGKPGFKMAVDPDGNMSGSIGGGAMEFQMANLARRELEDGCFAAFLKRQVHSPEAGEEASGLICAGEQIHAFVPLYQADEPTIRSVIECLESGNRCQLKLTPEGFHSDPRHDNTTSEHTEIAEGHWQYTETLTPPPTLYIFGGGHISVPMSEVAAMSGFRVVVMDNRKDLQTMTNNTFAHQKLHIDYDKALESIAHPSTAFVTIMTVAHASDQDILAQLLPLPLPFLGMIGSKKKVKTIFENLRAEGFTNEQLEKVEAPLGLAINSETPAEIAISIMARIIQVKNQP